jgi:hypothetical protein
MNAPDAIRYRLAPSVHACRLRGHVVLLDVRRDEYLGIDAADSHGFASLIDGWPVPDPAGFEPVLTDTVGATALLEMLEKGIVQARGARPQRHGRWPARETTVTLPAPAEALIEGYSSDSSHIRFALAARFVAASLSARALLRCRTLEYVVGRVRARNRRASERVRDPIDLERLRICVGSFRRLCPVLFTTQKACLFDSLALSEFLAGYRYFPRWVFGVAADPFAAHCWLQQDAVVVNDTPDHVGRFTPIMIV